MIADLIIKTNLFMSKRGRDIESRQNLIAAINALTGENSLDAIYTNDVANYQIPDVVVLPLYHSDFSVYLMNPDNVDTCPFGYTIEIHSRCFDRYTPEELTAVIVHDILQNVQSDTARIRFMKAYSDVIGDRNPEAIMDAFSELSISEVTFMMFIQICCRPFRVPVSGLDYTGTDDFLKAYGLADAYDSYLIKALDMSNDTPEDRVNLEIRNDYRDVKTIIDACLDKDIRHYYTMIREGVPLVSLEHLLSKPKTATSLGLISRKKAIKKKYVASSGTAVNVGAISESFMNPKDELELRFQIDKIISEIRYADSEAERSVMLYKIKTLGIKLIKLMGRLDKKLRAMPTDKNIQARIDIVASYQKELEELRKKVVNMEVKQKVWRIYTKQDLPEGYDF